MGDQWCTDHGLTLPRTYTVTTARGAHYYFAGPDGVEIGNSDKSFAGYAINVRGYAGGAGGYVVAAGSLHQTGSVYTANDPDADIAALPDQLVAVLARPGASGDAPAGVPFSACVPGLGNPNTDKIDYGHRHDGLVAYAGRLRAGGSIQPSGKVLFRERWLLCVQPAGLIPEARYYEQPPANRQSIPFYSGLIRPTGHLGGGHLVVEEPDPTLQWPDTELAEEVLAGEH